MVGMVLLFLTLSISTLNAQEQGNKDSQELLDRIETLEKQLKKLEDEGKARKSLEITEEEKTDSEKEVLEAVGREYSLSPKGTFSLDYNLSYAYSPAETFISQSQASQSATTLEFQRQADHTITHSIYTSYSILDNLTTSVNLPIVYRYTKQGTDDSLDQSDIGDISIGLAVQPPSAWSWLKLPLGINGTYTFGGVLPTGRSPFKINTKTELSTGSGLYQLSAGGSFSKQIDPLVFFWSLGYSYPFDKKNLNYRVQDQITLDEVKTGSSINFGMGMGYAMSYANSINMSFNYSYQKSSSYKYNEVKSVQKSGDRVSATYGIGMGLMVTPKTVISVSLGYNLISAGFSLSARVPFDFVM